VCRFFLRLRSLPKAFPKQEQEQEQEQETWPTSIPTSQKPPKALQSLPKSLHKASQY